MSAFNSTKFFCGTSGLMLPVPNKLFYPDEFKDKSRLQFYSSLMNSIEINSSFYKVPMPSTVKKWAAEVPDHFRFTFKLHKDITHTKHLAFAPSEVEKFFSVIAEVGEKKGCLLVQFPPAIRIGNFSQLRNLAKVIHEHNQHFGWKTALEFRHQSLYTEEVYELLEEFNLGMVLHDKTPAPNLNIDQYVEFRYLRFHGPIGDYRSSYPDDVLYEYAEQVSEWILEGKEVYTYFNNTMGNALSNLNLFSSSVLNSV
ncbi:MAG: DUF72 domain-containing protein [Pedobacter sp.]|nr:MAG: DUF72 domain-containing protein [Pedobacter sp.]